MTIDESSTASNEPQPEQKISPTRHQRKLTFNGLPNYDPVDVNIVDLRRSLHLAAMRRKKQHDKTLNHVGFLTALPTSKESLKHQEIFTFKEATLSNYELDFTLAMEHEIKNHTSRKHWKYEPMNEVPYDQILRST